MKTRNRAPVAIYKRCIPVTKEVGLSLARKELRKLLDMLEVESEMRRAELLTMLDEIGNNIIRHAGNGTICISAYRVGGRVGVRLVAEDRGRGIDDLSKAFSRGFSEDNGLGMGLNLLRSLSDDVRIASLIGGGTYVEAWKWI